MILSRKRHNFKFVKEGFVHNPQKLQVIGVVEVSTLDESTVFFTRMSVSVPEKCAFLCRSPAVMHLSAFSLHHRLSFDFGKYGIDFWNFSSFSRHLECLFVRSKNVFKRISYF